jgi:cytochrome c biogenesis protein CcmG/thiol:disulfide interchange protein DsbE
MVAALALVLTLAAQLWRPQPGTLLVMAGAETANSLDQGPLDLLDARAGVRLATRVQGQVPAAPDFLTVARATLAPGRYPGLRLGGQVLPADIEIRPNQVEPVLLAVSGGRVDRAGLYAGVEAVNLGLAELAHRYTPIGAFNLVDQLGRPFDNRTIAGREVVIAAFHTTCHETCPLYTGLFDQLRRQLPASVLLVEVTTDPVHDRPEILRQYAQDLGLSWTLATGEPPAVAAFWKLFELPLASGDSHSSILALVDRWGYVRLTYQGVPDLNGKLTPALQAQLNPEGMARLRAGGDWSAAQVAERLRTIRSLAERSSAGGGQAPEFALRSTSGSQVSLDQLRGRPLVLNFWASTCPPCRAEMPLLDATSRRHPGVSLLLVGVYEDPQTARKFLSDLRVASPALLDSNGIVASRYGVRAFPTTVFIRADGSIAERYEGPVTETVLGSRLASLEGG